MKKKILFCIHNPFQLDNLFVDIKFLSKSFSITILTTNYAVNENIREKYKNFQKDTEIEKIFFVPFYKKDKISRDIRSMILTHIFIRDLKKKIDFNNFDICISDTKFYIWQRIIFEEYINKNTIQIGLTLDSILIPLNKFKELLEGEDVDHITKNIHKLREKKKSKKKYSILKKFHNVYVRQRDIFFDRIFLSKIFQKKEFIYKEKDFKLMETDKFDFKLCFFYSSYFFWKKIYRNKCFLIKLKNECNCDKQLVQKKSKALFLSTLWNNYKGNDNLLEEKIDKIISFFNFLREKNNYLNQLDFRFHPMESKETITLIKNIFFKRNLTFVKFEDQNTPLSNLVCNYSHVIGALSSSLSYVKNFCNNIDVYCLRSLSENYAGEYFYLKLLNENVKHYDDVYNKFIEEKNFLSQEDLNVKVTNFNQFLSSISQKK